MTFAHQQLRSFVDRVCNLNDEIKALNGDKSEVYKEAKANGYDPKVLKAAVKRYTQLQDDRLGVQEFDAILELYMEALLGSGASDDQGGSKSPPAASASPAIGIVVAPTRAHAREGLPPHDEDDVLIEEPASALSDAEAGQEGGVGLSVAPPSVAVVLPDLATVAPDPSPEVRSGAPISEMPDIPEFLRRTGT